eukprot:03601.XXX_115616_115276_1 [CDS] Oithona nana genome sequencing.
MLAFFSLCFFINTSQGLYLTHALAGEVCAHEPTCLQNLPHLLKRFDYDRKLFLQRPTRNDRFLDGFMNPYTVQSCRTLDCIFDEMFHIRTT